MSASEILPSSFRDPSGFLFTVDGELYRQINLRAREDFDRLVDSGLYEELIAAGLLVGHEEVSVPPLADGAYKVIKPVPIRITPPASPTVNSK